MYKEKILLRASFTIEAAVVMPIVLIALVGLILFGYKLHDIVTANATANEAAELYGHLLESSDKESVYEYGNTRLSNLFSGKKYELVIEDLGNGSKATISGDDGIRSYEDEGFSPETFMRKMTVLEEVIDNE